MDLNPITEREMRQREQQLVAMRQVQEGFVGETAKQFRKRVDVETAPLAPGAPTPPPNPKQIYGDKKPRLSLTPLSAQLAQWEAQYDGLLKYTEVNWRKNPIEALTYVDAAMRHLRLYENGENFARDTRVQNLGAVMACCAILIDAELHGTLIDNRHHSPQTCDLLHKRGEEMVRVLREAQAQREVARNSK
jgi:hypothetical protein